MDEGIDNLEALVGDVQGWTQDLTHPLVFVSGFSGWGEALFGTINYWGGFEDIPSALARAGYTVIVVRIGPLSSNWERACEVYRQLSLGTFDTVTTAQPTTTTLDYGPNYPALYGFGQHGRTKQAAVFGNLRAGWKWSETNPVHFICHSQGGNTVRLLVELMSGAHAALHPTYFPANDRRSWIRSVSTVGTPHKGTTITDVVAELLPPDPIEVLTRVIAAASFNQPRFYDLQLDHWGFTRNSGESFRDMCTRIAPAVDVWWRGTPGQPPRNGFFDNSIDGVSELNSFARDPSPSTFYFTMSFDATIDFPHIDPRPEDLAAFPTNPLLGIPLIFLNPFGLPGAVGTWGYQRLPFSPSSIDYARWVVNCMNWHLGSLGFFNRIPLPGPRVPRPDMLPALTVTAFAMGGHSIPNAAEPMSKEYQHNDGVVNTPSMRGPDDARVRDISAFPRDRARLDADGLGHYWHFGINKTIDHADQIGVFTDPATYNRVERMYGLLASLVTRL